MFLLLNLFPERLIDARYKWSTKVKGSMIDMIIVLSLNVYFENLMKLISCPKLNETCTGTRMLIHDQWLLVNSSPLLIDNIVVDFYIWMYCIFACIIPIPKIYIALSNLIALIIWVWIYFTYILNLNKIR